MTQMVARAGIRTPQVGGASDSKKVRKFRQELVIRGTDFSSLQKMAKLAVPVNFADRLLTLH